MGLVALLVQAVEHPSGFLEELHRLGGLGTLGFGEAGKPQGTTGIAPVYVGYGGEPWRESPGMEEVHPVDVLAYLVDAVVCGHLSKVKACPRCSAST